VQEEYQYMLSIGGVDEEDVRLVLAFGREEPGGYRCEDDYDEADDDAPACREYCQHFCLVLGIL
jgi:hypothetical protein